MAISLTTVITDESRRSDLIAENTSCMLLRVQNKAILINCGGSPSVLSNNLAKLSLDISEVSDIVITSPIARYYSSLVYVLNSIRRRVRIYVPKCTLGQRLAEALRSRVPADIVLVEENLQLGEIKLLNVKLSSLYSEIAIEVKGGSLLLATPGLPLSTSTDLMLSLFSSHKNIVAGIPVPVISPDFRNVLSLLRKVSRSAKIAITHFTPPETKRILTSVLNVRRIYVGDTIKICC